MFSVPLPRITLSSHLFQFLKGLSLTIWSSSMSTTQASSLHLLRHQAPGCFLLCLKPLHPLLALVGIMELLEDVPLPQAQTPGNGLTMTKKMRMKASVLPPEFVASLFCFLAQVAVFRCFLNFLAFFQLPRAPLRLHHRQRRCPLSKHLLNPLPFAARLDWLALRRSFGNKWLYLLIYPIPCLFPFLVSFHIFPIPFTTS